MNNLTAKELKVLNNLSLELDNDVFLGNKIQSLINMQIVEGTPVNAVNATGLLTLTGVVINGEKVTIGSDTYEFLTSAAQTKTNESYIGVNIAANAVKATKNLTIDTKPTSGDTMTIGSKVYTFVPVGTDNADGEVSIGADLAVAQTNIVAAINGTDGHNIAHTLVSIGNFVANIAAVTAFIGGTVGNSISLAETFTAGTNVFAGATLSGGANCSAADAVAALIAAVNLSGTEDVTASAGTGTKMVLTADAGGVSANSIATTKVMANASFGHATLTGGIDGTVGVLGDKLVDESYLYILIDNNTKSGKNWRRISIGSAF